jgi:hypothetical protein
MDQATPNLPSRDFAATSAFYAALGFIEGWRDSGWMILERGALKLEYFPFPDLDPLTSSFGCCLRLDDLAAFYEERPDYCLSGRSRRQPAPPGAELTGSRVKAKGEAPR